MRNHESGHSFGSILGSLIEACEQADDDAFDVDNWVQRYPEHALQIRSYLSNRHQFEAILGLRPTSDPNANTLGMEGTAESIVSQVRYFGDYELLGEIARGGMGVVYKARQANLKRVVALKMILAGQLASERDILRFRTEAEAAANLDHPRIVPIYEVGEYEGQHFYSMGFVDGKSLADKLAHGPMQPRAAAELLVKICEGVAFAHTRGVIHRDLKPANILLDPYEQPKITDFGLAKRTDVDSNLTGTGQILGTPSFMAPEQAGGKSEIGPSADLYALGAILYCSLTGRPPFQAASPVETILQLLETEPVSPRTLNNIVPRDLETICLKCLQKDVRQRYSTVEELAGELVRFCNDEPIRARPIGRLAIAVRWAKRRPAVACMALALCLMILGLSIGGPLIALQQSALNAAAENARDQRARAQIDALLSANAGAVPVILGELRNDHERLLPLIARRYWNPDTTLAQRIRLSLFLCHTDPTQKEFLASQLTELDIAELRLTCNHIALLPKSVVEKLWQDVTNLQLGEDARFRLACSLAVFAPTDIRWKSISESVVAYLLRENSLVAADWVAALRPVSVHLVDGLEMMFHNRSEEVVAQRILATSILADYHHADPARLLALLELADSQQFRILFPGLVNHGNAAVSLLKQRLKELEDLQGAGLKNSTAVANVAIALTRLGEREHIRRLLQTSPDQSVRSLLIEGFASHHVSPESLFDTLEATQDNGVRQAIILALGNFPSSQMRSLDRDRLENLALEGLRSDNAAVSAASQWLLQNLSTTRHDRDVLTFPYQSQSRKGWYTNAQQQIFVILESGLFRIGSREDELGRRPDEAPVMMRIPRRLAMAATEVTVRDFQKFWSLSNDTSFPYSTRYSPSEDCPQTSVSWYDAAAYCNWLSEQEGIDENQWCFIPNPSGEYADGMALAPDYLMRTGYRLPTEAEWEYACRAGVSTTRHYGDSEHLLPRYAWYLANAQDRSWPVASKLPNCWGLFDMHGNVWEWCANKSVTYPSADGADDSFLQEPSVIRDGDSRALRGGSFFYHAIYTRCALRNQESVNSRYYGIGFRPVRTIESW